MKLFVFAAACAAMLRAQPLQLPIASLPPDTVVAKADGKPITAGEIRSLLETGDANMINQLKMSPEQFLGSVFVLKYLANQGDKAHLADESPLKEQLQYIHEKAVANAMVNQIRETYSVPEKDINDFYAQNSSRYEQAWIKVIAIGFCETIAPPAGTSDEDLKKAAAAAFSAAHCTSKHTEAQAKELADSIVAKIRGGADFVKMVAQYSEDDDSKATQGDFGLVTRENSFKPEIKNAVFALKGSEISEPIRSGDFFYIIKIKQESVQPLSNVRDSIVQELKQKHFIDWMNELQTRFKPVIERPDFFTKPATPGAPQLIPHP